ncbi:MAG TPA: NAD(P)-dependent oxidoreductase [Bacteroidetes bacterium]|nr:NAD(P)-dependent oxidoreductase [Bacteroidota bacterium]HIL57696.1 NAD(P)-dependent oxidoreductase [Rhodothermales bacterium]
MSETAPLAGKTLFITGGSRGIGEAIAIRAAQDGANVVVAAKTSEPHPKLPGTIHTAVEKVEAAGGKGLALQVDARDEDRVKEAVDQAAEHFGGIDIVVNNASAIFLATTEATPMKRYDLMMDVNVRATFCVTQAAMPYLRASAEAGRGPHILTLSPPLDMDPKWFANHLPYTMSKYGMSMCVLGWAREFKETGIAANALWPKTTIATAAVRNLLGGEEMIRASRTPEIVADAAHWIFSQDPRGTTGHFFLDEEVLRMAGETDFERYAVEPGTDLMPDLFL